MPARAADDDRTGPIPARAGVGLRFAHQRQFLDERPAVAWIEVHAENYMGGSAAVSALERLRADYPVSIHGVGLSLGSADGIERSHLQRLRTLVQRLQPGLVSEHLSWSSIGGDYLADLLPLPLTEETLQVFCRHVDQVQHALGRQILIENPSGDLVYRHSTIPEPEFLGCVAQRTGCGLLCDLNNVYVSSVNRGQDAAAWLAALPLGCVQEIHLAGHATLPPGRYPYLVDDHGSAVPPPVWALYRQALGRFGAVPTLIERDNALPPLASLLAEAAQADAIARQVAEGRDHALAV